MSEAVLVKRDTTTPSPLDRLRRDVTLLESFEDVAEALAQLDAVEAYAVAKGSRELTDKAIEVRCWIEKKAGELVLERVVKRNVRKAKPRSGEYTMVSLAHEIGVGGTTIARWRDLGAATDDHLSEAIRSIRTKRDLTVRGVQNEVVRLGMVKVEDGIWKKADGRYQIRVKVPRGEVRRTVGYDIGDARAALERERNAGRKPLRKNERADLRTAYSLLRQALQHVDRSRNGLNREARKAVDETLTVMHWAEDKLVETMKIEGV